MPNEVGPRDTSRAKSDPAIRLQVEEHDAQEPKIQYRTESTEDQVDRFVREMSRWFLVRLAQAKLIDVLQGALSAILAIAGIYALFIYEGQLIEMRKSTKATEQAAYAACVSAQLSRDALLEARAGSTDTHNLAIGSIEQANAVTRAEAAEVRVTRTLSSGATFEIGKPVVYPIEITNTGKTSALNMKIKVVLAFTLSGKEPSFLYKGAFNYMETGFLAPGDGPTSFRFEMKNASGKTYMLSEDKYETIKAGHEYLSIYGRLTYQDIFGVSHWTNFCIHANNVGTPTNTYAKCAAYNQTDHIAPIQQNASDPRALMPEIVCKKPEN